MLELWEMRSIPPLPSLPDPLSAEVVAPDRILSIGLIELIDIHLNYVLMLNRIV